MHAVQREVADDQALIREALAAMLDLEEDLEVVGVAGTCADAVAVATATRPDIVVLDVQMPPGGLDAVDGIDAIPPILAAGTGVRVIVVTTFGRPGYVCLFLFLR